MADAHEITSKEQWTAARLELMAREKELTRLRDELSAARRALPWRRIETDYVFDSADGPRRLVDLFGDSSQLLVYHFMFGADWEQGCPSCTFWADHFDAMRPHLRARDTAFAAVSTAPVATLSGYAERMGWRFPWVSAGDNGFNREFAVTFTEDEAQGDGLVYNFGTKPVGGREMPGASAFIRQDGEVFHTYSTYTRGLDTLNGTYHWLDLTAKGRDEQGLRWAMEWVKRHDEY
ncbi:MAG: DUF899 domain-containing protein [Myxococcota bacterium]